MRRNILIVDDDAQIVELVQTILRKSGYIVRSCRDGYGAVEELTLNSYDLVILDIVMPHMNGFQTIKSIRSHKHLLEIPIVMLTGTQNKDDILKAKQAGVAAIMLKPPRSEDLLSRIEKIFETKAPVPEIKFKADDPLIAGKFSLACNLKSVSPVGMTLEGLVQATKDSTLEVIELELFRRLKIETKKMKIYECSSKDEKYEYFVPFLGINKTDQSKINSWIKENAS